MRITKSHEDIIARRESLEDRDRRDFLLAVLPYQRAIEQEPNDDRITQLGEEFWDEDLDPDLGGAVRELLGFSNPETLAKVASECAWLNDQPALQAHIDEQEVPERAVAHFLLWEMGRLAGV